MSATHGVRFSIAGHKWDCPVPECQARLTTKYDLRRNFMFRHQEESVDIPGEGVYPRCRHCKMQVAPTVVGSHGHQTSATCRLGTERKVQRAAAESSAEVVEETFTAYGEELERVKVFKYLGRLLSWDNNDTQSMRCNLQKARRK